MAATPAHSKTPGSTIVPSFSADTFNQSSSLPTMIVHTGPMGAISLPSRPGRERPRSTASATAMACGTVKLTVALMLTPRQVASSMASIPAAVTGIFTMILGAIPAESDGLFDDPLRRPDSNEGSVWMESLPFLPPSRLEHQS